MAGYGDTHFLRQDQPQNIPDRRLDFRYHNLTFTGEDSPMSNLPSFGVLMEFALVESRGELSVWLGALCARST
jgi:hypothetical protein